MIWSKEWGYKLGEAKYQFSDQKSSILSSFRNTKNVPRSATKNSSLIAVVYSNYGCLSVDMEIMFITVIYDHLQLRLRVRVPPKCPLSSYFTIWFCRVVTVHDYLATSCYFCIRVRGTIAVSHRKLRVGNCPGLRNERD